MDVWELFISVCPEGSWGDNCTKTCGCMEANTERCTHDEGVCVCKEGWEGGVCNVDINECLFPAVHNCPENSECQNLNGSFYCLCDIGFSKASGGTCQGNAFFLGGGGGVGCLLYFRGLTCKNCDISCAVL